MRATGPPLVGAAQDLGWRDPLAEQHLESGRLRFDAYAMCAWVSGPVDPDTRVERAGWRVLAQQTGLSPHHVEMLCRRLRRTGHLDDRDQAATKRCALGGLVVVHDSLVDGADRARQHGGRV